MFKEVFTVNRIYLTCKPFLIRKVRGYKSVLYMKLACTVSKVALLFVVSSD